VPEEGVEFEEWCSEESPIFAALQDGSATFENLHEVFPDLGIIPIGSVPVAGTTAEA
jgi:hypothetical protein